ncbi:MAG TPA: dihydroorotase [Bacillales bacterium]|nr:dihydroorotase [Bacillales bacterium]
MGLLLKNSSLLDRSGRFEKKDVLISGEVIEKIADQLDPADHEVVDLEGKLLAPGFVDVHVHLREPGGEHKETIETGTQAAANGGFTTIAPMPNTKPVPDSVEKMKALNERIDEKAAVRVLPYASITRDEGGRELVDFEALAGQGCFAFTDDGVGVQNADMMLEAMKKAAAAGKAVVAHCEENSLIHGGSVHEGKFSEAHGLPGIPSVCESVHIARDVLLAEAAGAHYHVCHVSTKESVRLVRDAKRAGIGVTAEVTPHHLLLSEDDIPGVDTNFKMNPPLRAKEDRDALIEGLLDGTIDCIATDHAPHAAEEKAQSLEKSPFGIVGLETAFPLLYTHFVQKGILSLKQLVDFLTIRPSEAFNLPYGRLAEGGIADLTAVDLDLEQSVDPNAFASKGKNTPFTDWSCKGWPVLTIASGNIISQKGSVRV